MSTPRGDHCQAIQQKGPPATVERREDPAGHRRYIEDPGIQSIAVAAVGRTNGGQTYDVHRI